jgi:hypothetical protein
VRTPLNSALATLLNNEQGSDEYRTGAYALARSMTDRQRETLGQLVVHGPLPGEQLLDAAEALQCLEDWHLVTVVCVAGQGGYWAATGMGLDVATTVMQQ